MRSRFFTMLFASAAIAAAVQAEELKFQFTDPAFGGNPFNETALEDSANAQRPAQPAQKQNAAAEFSSNLQSALLGEISQNISNSILGEHAQNSGSFSVGTTEVDFNRTGGQITINIKDPTQGSGTTTIQMPVPQY